MYSFSWDSGKSGKKDHMIPGVSINPQKSLLSVAHMWHASADYSVPMFFNLDSTAANLEIIRGTLPQGVTLVPIERLLMKVPFKQWTESRVIPNILALRQIMDALVV